MKRFDAMWAILQFGKYQQRRLYMEGKKHEAFEIEFVREQLILFLNGHKVYEVAERIKEMTECYIDDKGVYKPYNPKLFVADERTRKLLLELKQIFVN